MSGKSVFEYVAFCFYDMKKTVNYIVFGVAMAVLCGNHV